MVYKGSSNKGVSVKQFISLVLGLSAFGLNCFANNYYPFDRKVLCMSDSHLIEMTPDRAGRVLVSLQTWAQIEGYEDLSPAFQVQDLTDMHEVGWPRFVSASSERDFSYYGESEGRPVVLIASGIDFTHKARCVYLPLSK